MPACDLKTRRKIGESTAGRRLYSRMPEKYTAFPFDVSVAELMEYRISEYGGGTEEPDRYVHGIGFDDIEKAGRSGKRARCFM